MNEETLFAEARGMQGEARAAFLDRHCKEDDELRRRLEALLRASDNPDPFLAGPCPVNGVTIDELLREGPGAVIGPYKLLEQIGEGGFGVVYMAEQTRPVRRKVALKILKPGMDTRQVVARFEAERQALAIMDHPNIARVFDGGATSAGRPYFVMELVRGMPITDFCDQNHLTPRQRLELFVPVCQAVQHAHHKGIIHRDLKPSNVLVCVHDTTPVVKVIDFGVAKALGQELTEKTLFTGFAQMIGTPLYMSPEQAGQSGLDIDTRSDIYSLGVLLYELLTGTTPFRKERFRQAACDEIRRIIREEEPPKPSTRLTESKASLPSISALRHTEPAKLTRLVRGELDWIVMKALEKDRNRRYETANGFVQDVQRYLADEHVHACPPSRWYRFRKLARRNKRALATASVLVMAVLAAVGILAVSNARISREATEKTRALATAQTSEQEAVESLKDALAAVDQMLTRVSEERLRDVPQMEPVRRELLQDALKFYQKFLEKRSDDPAIRRETALAYCNMASLHFQLGDYGKAEEAYRKGFAIHDELGAEISSQPEIRGKLIFHLLGFSWALRNQAKFVEGEMALRRAVTVAEGLRMELPEESLYRDHLVQASNRLAAAIASPGPSVFTIAPPLELEEAEKIVRRNLDLLQDTTIFWDRAQTYRNLSDVLAKQRRFPEAEEACRQGLLLNEKALAKWPSSRWLRGDLAVTLAQLARQVQANGRLQEADEIYRRALPTYDRFAVDFPAGPHHRWTQADVQFQHGLVLSRLKQPVEAERAFRRTVELFDKLAEDFPELPGYPETALHRRHHLAEFLAQAGRASEAAQQVYGESAHLLERLAPSEKAKAIKLRGHSYGKLAEWDKAAADFAKAIELGADDVLGAWYPLAVLHLRAGRTDEYRSLCTRLLEQFEHKDDLWVVITCKLAPIAVTDQSRPVQIAKRLVAREPNNAESLGMLGQTLYRLGYPEAAVPHLEAGVRSGPEEIGAPWRKLVLAMAYHQLGRGAEAQQLVQEVTRWMEKAQDKVEKGIRVPGPLSWAHRLDLQLMHREAEALLKEELKK